MYFWQEKKLFPKEISDLFVVYFDQRLGAVHSKTAFAVFLIFESFWCKNDKSLGFKHIYKHFLTQKRWYSSPENRGKHVFSYKNLVKII